jgi:uncharacterized DUF497 family protein
MTNISASSCRHSGESRYPEDHSKMPHLILNKYTFQEAASMFSNPMALTFADPDHSFDEDRDITFGFSILERLLVVSHTSRGERTRIISARPTTRQERKIYEEG